MSEVWFIWPDGTDSNLAQFIDRFRSDYENACAAYRRVGVLIRNTLWAVCLVALIGAWVTFHQERPEAIIVLLLALFSFIYAVKLTVDVAAGLPVEEWAAGEKLSDPDLQHLSTMSLPPEMLRSLGTTLRRKGTVTLWDFLEAMRDAGLLHTPGARNLLAVADAAVPVESFPK